jgi:hypothetical protein
MPPQCVTSGSATGVSTLSTLASLRSALAASRLTQGLLKLTLNVSVVGFARAIATANVAAAADVTCRRNTRHEDDVVRLRTSDLRGRHVQSICGTVHIPASEARTAARLDRSTKKRRSGQKTRKLAASLSSEAAASVGSAKVEEVLGSHQTHSCIRPLQRSSDAGLKTLVSWL